MYKLTSTFFLVLLYVSTAYSQATVDIPLSGSDGSLTIPLAIGLDPTATNGIDPQLGESDLPPFPPIGSFEIRLDLTPYASEPLSSYKDYRFAQSFPFTGQREHLLWWQTSTINLPIDITYNLPNGAAMILRDQLGGVILNLGPFTGTGVATIPASYSNIFAKCLLIMNYDVVPVELTLFTATVVSKSVQLNWHTATELNNQGFEIERKEAANWTRIGYVPGYGTTTEPRNYSFSDNNVSSGTFTYRLKQLDFGGGFSYSDEVSVEVGFTPDEYSLSQNYPNPFNPSTTINFSIPSNQLVTIKVYNTNGEVAAVLVNGNLPAGYHSVKFNASGLASGIYIVKMIAGNFSNVKKMNLLK